jgi:hypothetical protein
LLPVRYKLITPLFHAVRVVACRIAALLPKAAVSWVAWFLAVAAFAVWTLFHYHAPAAPPWIGMTIRTSVFAFWALVLREWLAQRIVSAST